MSAGLLKLLLFFGCFFGWGFSTVIMGYLGKVMSFETALFYNLVGVALCNLFLIPKITLGWSTNHFWAVMNGVAFTVADFSYYRLSYGGLDISTLGPLTSLYVLCPILLGIFLFKEPVTPRKALGLVLAILAIYILSSEEHNDQPSHMHDSKSDVEANELAHTE